MPTLAYNKRASFDYDLLEKYEAGLVLFGHEVKSIKTGHCSLKGSFVSLYQRNGGTRLILSNAHIPLYAKASTIKDYNPDRPREILVKAKESKHLIGKKKEQGLTLVPIRIYTKRGLLKLEFAIGKGKKKIDKRQDIKKREAERSMRQALKSKA